jgi:hypothetical protein
VVPVTIKRGWSSDGLKTVGDDPELWTVSDASKLHGPPDLSVREVRNLVKILNMEPVGKRRVTADGHSGRHARVYRASEFIKAYDAIQKVI